MIAHVGKEDNMTNRTWLLAPLMALLGALMLFAACGGGDDDDSSSDDGDSEPTATEAASDGDGDDGDDGDAESDATPTEDAGDDEGDDEGDDGGSGGADEACALLTDVEVEFILGGAVTDPEPSDFDPFFSCLWQTEDFSLFRTLSVGVYRDNEDAVEAYYELTTDAEEVVGLGDRAQWSSDFIMQVEVLEGNCDLTISISGLDEEEARNGAIGLAERALGRLEGC